MKIIILISSLILVPFVAFSQSCLPEGIEFNSQSQIDLFFFEYPGCTDIEGDVRISSGNNITNLNGLSMLNSIGGSLKINNNYALVDLAGLEGLHSVGSDLWIYGNSTLFSLSGLDNLESIGGLLQIVYNPGLEDITDIQSLDAASIIDLTITDNTCLTDCNAQSLCDYLAAPHGIVTIYNNAPGCSSPPEIAESCNMQMPCLPFGNYYFTTQAQINSFSVDYPNCSRLNSFVQISGHDITDLSGLSGITSIDGTLSVSDNQSLYNLEGLDNLDSITEHLYIGYNESLISLAGLDSLSYIGGSLVAVFNTALSSLDGLDSVTSIGGNLKIGNNDALESLQALSKLKSLDGSLMIYKNNGLTSLSGLDNIDAVSIKGITIYDNSHLSTCEVNSVCDYLSSLTGNASIENNAEGCNSSDEVLEACVAGVDQSAVGGRQSAVRVYPNPSGGIVDFRLLIADCGRVTLKLYDNTGQDVATLTDKAYPAGEHNFLFNTSALKSGLYYYRLTCENQSISGKLSVIH